MPLSVQLVAVDVADEVGQSPAGAVPSRRT
jgi:hypothetical protein